VARWAAGSEPLSKAAARFLDFRLAYGDRDLADDLRRVVFDAAGGPRGLAHALVPGRRVDGGGTSTAGVDPVLAGMARIEDAARALAVAARIAALSTAERLAEACSRTGLPRRTADELTELHERLLAALLAQQGRDLAAGRPPSYRVDHAELDGAARAELDAAVGHTAGVGDVVRMALALV
jgi:signal-transduction protein with cAMP-binding, CBS, and nucleotidyltransferase domain